MSKRFLVCPPTHYAVNYDINPWMTRNVGYSAPDAQRHLLLWVAMYSAKLFKERKIL